MASSIPQARNGTLYLMVAGREEASPSQAAAREDELVPEIRRPGGKAAEVKALVNMVMNVNTAGLAEGLGLADALGLDLDVVREIFSQTGANRGSSRPTAPTCRIATTKSTFRPSTRPRIPASRSRLAEDAGLRLPLARATYEQYERMKRLGLGELDKSGVSELTFISRHGKDQLANA